MMRRRYLFVLMCILVSICFVGCGGSQIEKEIKTETESIVKKDPTVAKQINKMGIGKLSEYEVDTSIVTDKILGSVAIKINSEEKENKATAVITITHFDMDSAIKLLDEKSTEFRNNNKVIDMEKAKRYKTGKDNLNQVLEVTETKEEKITIEFNKSDDEWTSTDDIYSSVLDCIISEDDVKKFVEAYEKGYAWKFDDKNAGQVAEILKAEGLNIGEIQSFNEETDPNQELGRPGGYTSKSNFFDNGLLENAESYELEYEGVINYDFGGTIEVFENAKLAKNRGDYLEELSVTTPYNKYYTYRFCNVVLRIGDAATPSQAKAYANAFYERNN